ncbi:hypothetical protein GA830_10640 [Mesorhizobium sp. NBSH29]|uniref:phage tail assembly protein n=1 Tax=Mesorhizobium sp. NBSH29 TaxID=2654249 RepID=UPI0018965112|nr:phage tail assembly protein [Mesorhizobium sp. NBSH29]QPC87148.1 hypothetical protein GA830_10640 [Mesorhizobium sp. NBSH29]
MTDRIARAIKQPQTQIPEGAAQKAAPRFLVPTTEKTYDLKYPLEWEGVEYRQLAFKRLKGKDFKKFSMLMQMGADEGASLISLVAGIPVEIAQELDGEDFINVLLETRDFMPARFQEAMSGQTSETGLATQE